MVEVEHFGCIPIEAAWSIAGYNIRPAESYTSSLELLADAACEKLAYPPRGEKMFKLPPTHLIERGDGAELHSEFRQREGALVVHALGFLYGVRCLFEGWWFDSPIPTQAQPIGIAGDAEIARAAEGIVSNARAWPEGVRDRFVSALYLKRRNGPWQWAWEWFSWEYVVFDSLYRCAVDLNLVGDVRRHHERFEALMDAGLICGEAAERAEAQLFVAFRNPLIHEGQWLYRTPASDSYQPGVYALSRLNERLAISLTGVSPAFGSSPWVTLSPTTLLR